MWDLLLKVVNDWQSVVLVVCHYLPTRGLAVNCLAKRRDLLKPRGPSKH